MGNQVFVSTTFVKDQQKLSYALDMLRNLNIDGVELGSNHCFEEDYSYIHEYNYRYLTHNYFPIPRNSFVINLASNDSEIRHKSLAHAKKAIDFSAENNCEIYTVHPGFVTDPLGAGMARDNYDFNFSDDVITKKMVKDATDNLYKSLDKLVNYSKGKLVNLAIETEGSRSHYNKLLMQKPEDYASLFEKFSPYDIGINLNIGHLALARNEFNFCALEFCEFISEYVIAMELSHNNGHEDEHLPLINEEWYWQIILDDKFLDVPKILEFRNTSISEINKNILLMKKDDGNV